MTKHLAFLVAVGAVTLAACGSETDVNEKNFGAAMTRYFEKKGDLCLNIRRWPVDVGEMDFRLQKIVQAGSVDQMAALEAVGLVQGEDIEVDATGAMGKPTAAKTTIRRYTLTDAARPFTQERGRASTGPDGTTTERQADLCWGRKALDKIVKWEGPMKLGGYLGAGVTYTYKVDNVAEWATKPEVQAAFPAVKDILDGAGSKESRHAIRMTGQGWQAKGLD